MNINMPPKIISTVPKNYEADVATNLKAITIGFSTDLDSVQILGNVRLENRQGIPIPISISYAYRTITVTIKQELDSNTPYQLTLFGNGNIDDTRITGIRSALQVPMQGNAVINFTTMKNTALLSPIGSYPADRSIVENVPAFTWETEDETVALGSSISARAVRYEIEVSTSNTMSPIHWATEIDRPPVYPSVPFGNGIYYWHIRAIDANRQYSDWSPLYSFNLDTIKESPVSPEDTLPPEIGYDPLTNIDSGYVEIIDYFPKETYSNVATNLNTIYFTVLGTITSDDVSLEMIGESVLGDNTDHGSITGTLEVLPQLDGTTIIAYTPDPLQISTS